MRATANLALSNFTGVAERKGYIFPTNTITLKEFERHVKASTVSANGAFTITLAPPEETAGSHIFIEMVARNSTDDITITGGDEGGNVVLNAAGENVLLYSTGSEYLAVYADGPTVKG